MPAKKQGKSKKAAPLPSVVAQVEKKKEIIVFLSMDPYLTLTYKFIVMKKTNMANQLSKHYFHLKSIIISGGFLLDQKVVFQIQKKS